MCAAIEPCSSCGSTGDRWNGVSWGRGYCWICDGWGSVVRVGKETYPLAGAYGLVYRDSKGQFARIPRAIRTN